MAYIARRGPYNSGNLSNDINKTDRDDVFSEVKKEDGLV